MKRNIRKENSERHPAEMVRSSAINNNVLDFSTTLTRLRKTVDPALIRRRADGPDQNGNVQMVEYVEWHTVADILDEHAPNWVHAVKDIRPIGDILAVTVSITIDGVTREGVGTARCASESGIKMAEHDALKRAAVKFGIARELYERESNQGAGAPEGAERGEIAGPIAKNVGDMITSKQSGLIRSIARQAAVDAERKCSEIMHCGVTELSKRAASDLIDHLLNLQQTQAAPMRHAG